MTMLDNWLVPGVLCNATKLKFNEFRFVDSFTGVTIIHFSNIVNNKQRRIVAARRSPFLGRPISDKVAESRAKRHCIWSCIRFVNKICLLLLLLLCSDSLAEALYIKHAHNGNRFSLVGMCALVQSVDSQFLMHMNLVQSFRFHRLMLGSYRQLLA